ncbi:MAG: hypothetical protein V7459_02165 [Oceanicoccus sp.]
MGEKQSIDMNLVELVNVAAKIVNQLAAASAAMMHCGTPAG